MFDHLRIIGGSRSRHECCTRAVTTLDLFQNASKIAEDINGDGSVEVKEFLSWLLLPDDPGEDEGRIIRKLQVSWLTWNSIMQPTVNISK